MKKIKEGVNALNGLIAFLPILNSGYEVVWNDVSMP